MKRYSFYRIEVSTSCGRESWKIRALSKETAVRQINRIVRDNHKADCDPWWERAPYVYEIHWNTLEVAR